MVHQKTVTRWTLVFSFLLVLFFGVIMTGMTHAETQVVPLRGQARGIAHIQGHSGPDSVASLSFYNVGKLSKDKAYGLAILKIDATKNWPAYELQGTFSGGPNGTLSFPMEYDTATIPLQNGKVFFIEQPGLWVNLTVSNPAIFDAFAEEEEAEPAEEPEEAEPVEEADPGEKARDSGARMSHIDGQLEIACPPNLEAWDVMKMGRVIYVNCHLRTGEESTAEISFSDMTTFKMRPESEIVIDTPPEKESKMSLIMGNIWVNVKQMIKDGTMKVHGSQAVAGIKGTTFVMEEDGEHSTLKVIEGVVAYAANADSASRDIAAGQQVVATKAGLGETTEFDVAAENTLWANTPPSRTTITTKGVIGGIVLIFIIAGVVVVVKRKQK